MVYKAEDTKLDRLVALKFLPSHVTASETEKARFLQEAKAASAINHPNVCVIHDIKEREGQWFIVMEYVDGVTLSHKIQEGQLPLKSVIDYAMQIAEALNAAHAKGIVHRDIKSENIMINTQDQVKVMDFGLAKLKGTVKLTKTTSTVGTLAYMSPEQIQGGAVDARSDIFSFGVVLYEMLTGKLPFHAEYDSATMYAILNEEPEPVDKYRPDLSSEFLHVLNRALEKESEDRYQNSKEILIDLRRIKRDTDRVSRRKVAPIPSEAEKLEEIEPHVKQTKKKRTSKRFVIPAIAVAVLILAALGIYLLRPLLKKPLPPMKTIPLTSLPGVEWRPVFSPNGDQIAFSWNGKERDNYDIYVKLIAGGASLRLTSNPGIDTNPAWSPDGSRIAFVRKYEDEYSIYTIPALGGPERKLAILDWAVGGWYHNNLHWSPDGKYLGFREGRGIFLLSVESLEKHELTSPSADFDADNFCSFSPDGKTLAFVREMNYTNGDVFTVPITGGEPKRLTFNDSDIHGLAWTPDSREIVFSSNHGGSQSLWRISAGGGSPEQVAVGGRRPLNPALSLQGRLLAYVDGSSNRDIWRIEMNESKSLIAGPLKLISSTQMDWQPQFSPDGTRIVFSSLRSGNYEIWACDSDVLNPAQITNFGSPHYSGYPNWSPDGKTIVFDSSLEGQRGIFTISSEGGTPKRISSEGLGIHPSFSRDGQWIYFGGGKIKKISVRGGDPVQLTKEDGYTPFESFDGNWVYYAKRKKSGVWKTSSQGGGEEFLVFEHPVLWQEWALSKDGIYYINKKAKVGSRIEFFSFKTDKAIKIVELNGRELFYLAVSPDSRWLLYTQAEFEGDIVLVKNFR